MSDRTDSAISQERDAAIKLGWAIRAEADHHRLKYTVKSGAISRLLATTNPATDRPFTQKDASDQTLLDPEYAAWDAEMTRLQIDHMLAETELHVAKQTLEYAVRTGDDDWATLSARPMKFEIVGGHLDPERVAELFYRGAAHEAGRSLSQIRESVAPESPSDSKAP